MLSLIFLCITICFSTNTCEAEFGGYKTSEMAVPTITMMELEQALANPTTKKNTKHVLEGILNDYMALLHGIETPYTTGKQVLPLDCTIQQVDEAKLDDTIGKKFTDVFTKISDTFKSGDLTPQPAENNGIWDPKYKPVLVCVTPNKYT